MNDDARTTTRTPTWFQPHPGGPVLVHAVSGLGKSTLAFTYPSCVLDADTFLYDAVAAGFPNHEPRARLREWRALCERRPWLDGGAELARWAAVRRAFLEPFLAAMTRGTHPLVLTSLLDPPWFVSAYYGVERGRYMEHLGLVRRVADNRQSEAMNDRLDGYLPLVRVPAGSFLGERAEILAVIAGEPSERGTT
jgi:hypothetical protein